jgi:hypothetical protein
MKVLNRQSVFDVAVQTAGTPEAAFEVALKNGLSITDEIDGLEIEKMQPVNKEIEGYYRNNRLLPATGFSPDDSTEEGIEFWYVEYDMVVG